MATDDVGADNAGAKELTGSVAHWGSSLLRPLVAGRTSESGVPLSPQWVPGKRWWEA